MMNNLAYEISKLDLTFCYTPNKVRLLPFRRDSFILEGSDQAYIGEIVSWTIKSAMPYFDIHTRNINDVLVRKEGKHFFVNEFGKEGEEILYSFEELFDPDRDTRFK